MDKDNKAKNKIIEMKEEALKERERWAQQWNAAMESFNEADVKLKIHDVLLDALSTLLQFIDSEEEDLKPKKASINISQMIQEILLEKECMGPRDIERVIREKYPDIQSNDLYKSIGAALSKGKRKGKYTRNEDGTWSTVQGNSKD